MSVYQIVITSLTFIIFILVEILIRNYSKNVNSIVFVFRRTSLTLFFSVTWLIASGTLSTPPSVPTVYRLVICAIMMTVGLIGFVESNKYLALTNILSIQMLGIFIKLLTSDSFLNQFPQLLFLVCLFFSFIGLYLHFSLPENRIGLFWAIVSMLGWSFGYEFLYSPLKEVGAPWAVSIIDVVMLLGCMLFLLLKNKTKEITSIIDGLDVPIVIIALLSTVSILLLSFGAKIYPIELVSYLNFFIYLLSILLVRIVFKEVILTKEWVGNVLIFLAVVFFFSFIKL